MRALVVVAVVALAAPALARADGARMVTRELPLTGARALASAAPVRFNLVGLHWRGSGDVLFRTRSLAGRWSRWRPAAPAEEDGPDVGAGERGPRGWRLGNPHWTGASDRLQYRVRGRVQRLRAHYVWSDPLPAPPRALSLAGSPLIVRRSAWGANEAIRRGGPSYAPTLRLAVVHHTAGGNTYTPAQSAAIVRGIQLYHVRANGWNDIGYNFLVDRFGRVFEGRYGGVDRNVVGAHTAGYNTGTVGVALVGNHAGVAVPSAARTALARLLAWRLDVAHVDPQAPVTGVAAVPLRAVVGHRDLNSTTCPGGFLYAGLSRVAGEAGAIGLPKLYAPAVRGGLGGPVRFTARLSEPLPWTVTIADAAGRPVAGGGGRGSSVGWTWDATAVIGGRFTWTIAAGPTVRAATGTVGTAAPAPVLERPAAEPALVTPNGDGRDDVTTIAYTLGTAATVTAVLASGPTKLATLFSEQRPPGRHRFTLAPESLADGAYRVVITAAAADGRRRTAAVPLLVSRALVGFRSSPATFSPNGDGRQDAVHVRVELAEPADVSLAVSGRGATPAVPLATGPLAPGAHALTWNGRGAAGRARDGVYALELTVTSAYGTVTARARARVDTAAPRLRVASFRPLRLWVSEPATVVVESGALRRRARARRAGVVAFALPRAARRVRVVAIDLAGNRRAIRYP